MPHELSFEHLREPPQQLGRELLRWQCCLLESVNPGFDNRELEGQFFYLGKTINGLKTPLDARETYVGQERVAGHDRNGWRAAANAKM